MRRFALLIWGSIGRMFFSNPACSPPPKKFTDSPWNRLEDTKLYGNASERQAAHYDRNHPRYPYKSHGQWLKGFYGMTACIILVMFNGVSAFLERPFDVRRFVASYISVSFLPSNNLHVLPSLSISVSNHHTAPRIHPSNHRLQNPQTRPAHPQLGTRTLKRFAEYDSGGFGDQEGSSGVSG
jgi:hypothetical protein